MFGPLFVQNQFNAIKYRLIGFLFCSLILILTSLFFLQVDLPQLAPTSLLQPLPKSFEMPSLLQFARLFMHLCNNCGKARLPQYIYIDLFIKHLDNVALASSFFFLLARDHVFVPQPVQYDA